MPSTGSSRPCWRRPMAWRWRLHRRFRNRSPNWPSNTKAGARSLRGIFEEMMVDIMYAVPDHPAIKRVKSTRCSNPAPVRLSRRAGEKQRWPHAAAIAPTLATLPRRTRLGIAPVR